MTPAQDVPRNVRGFTIGLWIRWVTATSVSGILSYFIAGGLVTARAEADTSGKYWGGANFMTGDNAIDSLLLWVGLLILVVGPSIALAQALVLRTVNVCIGWRRWVFITSLAAAASISMAWVAWIGVILPGVIIGFAQWSILAKCFQRANWWVMVTVSAEIAALAAGFAMTYVLPSNWLGFPSYPFYPLMSVVYWTGSWAVGLIVFSAFTGLGLIWLLWGETGLATGKPAC
jgi:hypothetical protein